MVDTPQFQIHAAAPPKLKNCPPAGCGELLTLTGWLEDAIEEHDIHGVDTGLAQGGMLPEDELFHVVNACECTDSDWRSLSELHVVGLLFLHVRRACFVT
eukprot:1812268-Amphidinium_carterae.1